MKITKKIDVFLSQKRIVQPVDVVQYDTGVQLILHMRDFTIPDGTECTLYVQKPSGKFLYQETGISVTETTITIDLENQAITESGDRVPYQVRLKNGDDRITTFIGAFRVEKSVADSGAVKSETVVAAFEEKTAEQIAKIEAEANAQIARVQAASQAEQAAILALSAAEQKSVADKGLEVLNTIPADYTALSARADRNQREKAPAVVCEAEGEVIAVSDASDDYVRVLRIFGKTTQNGTPSPDSPVELTHVGAGGAANVKVLGKNLIAPTAKNETIHGVVFTVNADGSITANGTAKVDAFYTAGRIAFHAGKTYVLTGCPAGGNSNTAYCIYIGNNNAFAYDTGNGEKLKSTSTVYNGAVRVLIRAGCTVSDLIFYPMIRYEDVAEATYEPSRVQTLTAQTPNGLPGIPVTTGGNYTDANGQQWICDEVDFGRGVYVQRVERVELKGTEALYIANTTGEGNYVSYTDAVHEGALVDYGYCSHFKYGRASAYAGTANYIGVNTNGKIWLCSAMNTERLRNFLAEQDAAQTPVTIYYPRSAPIETPLSVEELAAYAALHTNKPYTTVYNDAGAHMALAYHADTKTYIDNKFTELKNAILAAGANI